MGAPLVVYRMTAAALVVDKVRSIGPGSSGWFPEVHRRREPGPCSRLGLPGVGSKIPDQVQCPGRTAVGDILDLRRIVRDGGNRAPDGSGKHHAGPLFLLQLEVGVESRRVVRPVLARGEHHQNAFGRNAGRGNQPILRISGSSSSHHPWRLMDRSSELNSSIQSGLSPFSSRSVWLFVGHEFVQVDARTGCRRIHGKQPRAPAKEWGWGQILIPWSGWKATSPNPPGTREMCEKKLAGETPSGRIAGSQG